MKKKIFIIIAIISFIAISLSVFFVYTNRVPDVDIKTIKKDYKVEHPDVGSIENLKIVELDIDEKDDKKIKETFTDEVKSKKIGIQGVFRDSEVEISGKYTMLYAYINKKFKLVEMKDVDLKNRKYRPIGHVSSQRILKDLRESKIGDFKKGYVGREKYTSLDIGARKTDLDLGKDTIEITISVKNSFAKTKIKGKLVYEFKEKEWVLKDKLFEDKEHFLVEFITDNLPKEPNEEAITNILTDSKNQKTYMTNKAFTKKTYVSKPRKRAVDDILTYEYLFIASYDHIGDIEYKVEVPYAYSDGEWIRKDVNISFNKAILSGMKSKWGIGYDKNKKNPKEYFCFYKSEGNVLEGYYGNTEKKELIRAVLDVDLKDNNWTMIVVPVGLEDGLKSILTYSNISLNLKDKIIVADSKNFNNISKITEDELNEFNNKESEKLKAFDDKKQNNKDNKSGGDKNE